MKQKLIKALGIIAVVISTLLITSCFLIPEQEHIHTPKDPLRENYIEPTCTSPGCFDEVVFCSTCNEEFKRETKQLPKSAHYVEDGRCIVCNRTETLGLEYEFNEPTQFTPGYYTLVGIGTCTDNDIIIPMHHDGVLISKIAESAFANNDKITSISIQSNIKTVANYLFKGSPALSSVFLGEGVKSIGLGAFSYCTALDSITLPSSLEHIDNDVFNSSSSMRKANFLGSPNQWCKIYFADPWSHPSHGSCELYFNGEALTDIKLEEGLDEIKAYAFYNCKNLKTVSLPNSLQKIDGFAFTNCNSIELNEYDNALYIGNSENPYLMLFKVKDASVSSCKINEATKFINDSAFYKCTNLTSLALPEGLLGIGFNCFDSCKSLTEITIPKNVTYVENYAFSYSGLKTVTFNAENCSYAYSIFSHTGYDNGGLDVIIGAGVLKIPPYMFTHSGGGTKSANINSITFEENSQCVEISRSAFKDCPQPFNVYFNGTQEQWNKILIDTNNDPLLSSNFNFK